jgi:hypothetical protein
MIDSGNYRIQCNIYRTATHEIKINTGGPHHLRSKSFKSSHLGRPKYDGSSFHIFFLPSWNTSLAAVAQGVQNLRIVRPKPTGSSAIDTLSIGQNISRMRYLAALQASRDVHCGHGTHLSDLSHPTACLTVAAESLSFPRTRVFLDSWVSWERVSSVRGTPRMISSYRTHEYVKYVIKMRDLTIVRSRRHQ